MTDKHTMTASNCSVIGLDRGVREVGKNVYIAELISGSWPSRDELLSLADGGGDYAAYFGGNVESLGQDNFKRVTIFTD